jgi:hypothetical protein
LDPTEDEYSPLLLLVVARNSSRQSGFSRKAVSKVAKMPPCEKPTKKSKGPCEFHRYDKQRERNEARSIREEQRVDDMLRETMSLIQKQL